MLGHPVTSTGYDTFGEPVQTEDPDGNVTTTAYDADGNPVSQTLPGYTPPGTSTPITAVSVRQYDNLGQVIADTDPLNDKTAYTYDQLGDLATTTTPDGGVTHSTYDTNGDRLSETGPTGAMTQATYDYLGRPLTATALDRYPAASTSTTTNSYAASTSDPGGAWLASSTTQDGVTTSYGYDNVGRDHRRHRRRGQQDQLQLRFPGPPGRNDDGGRHVLDGGFRPGGQPGHRQPAGCGRECPGHAVRDV